MKKQFFKTAIPVILLAIATLFIGSSCGDDTPCESLTWYYDNDGDGFGDPEDTEHIWYNLCEKPAGSYVADNTDCDDNNDTVYPGAPELCDGLDNNCDGEIDNSTTDCEGETICIDGQCVTAVTFYRDNDNDSFGNPDDTTQGSGTPPEGWVLWAGDCDDNNDLVNVLADEIMGNGIDDNCNGLIDTDDVRYLDIDGDGYGSQDEAAGPGVFNRLDCNDDNANIHPYNTEIYGNNIDDDCDGSVD